MLTDDFHKRLDVVRELVATACTCAETVVGYDGLRAFTRITPCPLHEFASAALTAFVEMAEALYYEGHTPPGGGIRSGAPDGICHRLDNCAGCSSLRAAEAVLATLPLEPSHD